MAPTTPHLTPKRRSRADLRELMLVAGLELIAAQPHINAAALNYKTVFDHLQQTREIRVTHASVHERIWPSQRAYQLDVLRRAAEGLPAPTFLDEAGAAATVVREADLETNDGRRQATREMIRVSCNADISSADVTLSVYRTIRMALAGLDESDDEYPLVERAIEETRVELGARYVELFHALTAALRLRPRAALDTDLETTLYRLFAQVVALADGFTIDGANENRLELPTGPNGELQDWHLYSWSVWSAARTVLELDGEMPDEDRAL